MAQNNLTAAQKMALATAMADWVDKHGAFRKRKGKLKLHPDGTVELDLQSDLNFASQLAMSVLLVPMALGLGVAGAVALPELLAGFLALEAGELMGGAVLMLGSEAVQALLL